MNLYIKYFKKYWKNILISLLFVAGQVSVMLALPKYMANMISVGIQQKGIETFVYEGLNEQYYNSFYFALPSKHQSQLKQYYVKENQLYKLNTTDKQERQSLEKTTIAYNNMVLAALENQNEFLKVNNLVSIESLYRLSDEQKQTILNKYTSEKLSSGDKLKQANLIAMIEKNSGLEDRSLSYVYSKGVEMLLVAASGMIFVILVSYFTAIFSSKVAKELRQEVFEKIESFSNQEFENFSTASLITRTITDTKQIQDMIGFVVRIGFMSPVVAIGAFIQSGSTNVDLIWIIGLGIITLVIISLFLIISLLPKFEKFQLILDKINLILRENLTGLRVIRAFHSESVQDEKFYGITDEMRSTNYHISKLIAFSNPSFLFLTNITTVLIVYFGAPLVTKGTMDIGGLLSFIQFATQVLFSFMMVGMLFFIVPRITIALKRIDEVLESKNIIDDIENPLTGDNSGTVEFRNVSFLYDEDSIPAIENLSFKVEKGKTIAFIGGTGSGKSTIGKLLNRFYDVTSGEILVNGVNIKEQAQDNLRQTIGYIPQIGQVFSLSIKENIAYGRDVIEQEKIERAARIACADEFINEKEERYDYVLEQRGANLSGGQKQRIQIARAIYKNTNILFFDDSFSALDYKTDVKLRSNLKKEMQNASILIVAQRIPTIVNADEIIVLDEGKVVGRGTHKELIQSCAVYQDIAASQIEEGK